MSDNFQVYSTVSKRFAPGRKMTEYRKPFHRGRGSYQSKLMQLYEHIN